MACELDVPAMAITLETVWTSQRRRVPTASVRRDVGNWLEGAYGSHGARRGQHTGRIATKKSSMQFSCDDTPAPLGLLYGRFPIGTRTSRLAGWHRPPQPTVKFGGVVVKLQRVDFFADPSVLLYDDRLDLSDGPGAGFPWGWRSIPERRFYKGISEPLSRQRCERRALPFRRLHTACTRSEPGRDVGRESVQPYRNKEGAGRWTSSLFAGPSLMYARNRYQWRTASSTSRSA